MMGTTGHLFRTLCRTSGICLSNYGRCSPWPKKNWPDWMELAGICPVIPATFCSRSPETWGPEVIQSRGGVCDSWRVVTFWEITKGADFWAWQGQFLDGGSKLQQSFASWPGSAATAAAVHSSDSGDAQGVVDWCSRGEQEPGKFQDKPGSYRLWSKICSSPCRYRGWVLAAAGNTNEFRRHHRSPVIFVHGALPIWNNPSFFGWQWQGWQVASLADDFKRCNLVLPWLYLSEYFDRYKDEYVNNLFNVSVNADWKSYLEFCLRATVQQAREAIVRFDSLVDIQRKYQKIIASSGGSARLSTIVESLFNVPFITIPDVRELLNTTYPTAKNDIEQLISLQILKPLARSEQRPKISTQRKFSMLLIMAPDWIVTRCFAL